MLRPEEWTGKDIKWFSERVTESVTGRILVSSSLVKKYRKISGDEFTSNAAIRSDIINVLQLADEI